jgi:hypothetical protein
LYVTYHKMVAVLSIYQEPRVQEKSYDRTAGSTVSIFGAFQVCVFQ